MQIIVAFAAWPFEPAIYVTREEIRYYSKRYKKWITVPIGFHCDGSTCSPNLGIGWIVHDWTFASGLWDDGTPILWRQANRVMQDIMQEEGWPQFVINIYRRGVQSKMSLKAWQKHRAGAN